MSSLFKEERYYFIQSADSKTCWRINIKNANLRTALQRMLSENNKNHVFKWLSALSFL